LYEIETISKMNNYAIIYDMISLSACAYSDVETNWFGFARRSAVEGTSGLEELCENIIVTQW